VWFFYFFWKLEFVAFSALGYTDAFAFWGYYGVPYVDQQMFGAYLAIIGFALWTGRRHFRSMWRGAIGSYRGQASSPEALPPRLAVFGAFAGFLLMVFFTYLLGLSLLLGVIFVALYLFIAVAITRVRAELGPPVQDFPSPLPLLTNTVGARNFSPRDLTPLAYLSWNTRIFRAHPMPQQLEAFRIAERARGSLSGMSAALIIAGVFGALASFWAYLHLAYWYGASARMREFLLYSAIEAFGHVRSGLGSQQGFNPGAAVAILVGLAFAAGSMMLRTRLVWWPFHPIGFAMAGNYSTNWFWLPLLISWIIKASVLRYGGLRAYRQTLLPLAYGLILGDFSLGGFWALWVAVTKVKIYSFFP